MVHTLNFITTKIQGQIMISNKQNFENEASKVGFVLLKKITEKLKVKIKLIDTKFNNHCSCNRGRS